MRRQTLAEADVSKQVSDFLQWRGWRRVRNNVGFGMFGERGMPDLVFLHYFREPAAAALVLWVEVKRPGARMACSCKVGQKKACRHCGQLKWRTNERQRGAIVLVIDSLKELEEEYERFVAGTLREAPGKQGRLELTQEAECQ